MSLSDCDLVWNRACLEGGGRAPGVGDRALAGMLRAHGLVMNGGVYHAVECLSVDELRAALDGYRFFALDRVTQLLLRAANAPDGDEIEERERLAYAAIVPDDQTLEDRFRSHFASHPELYAPLRSE